MNILETLPIGKLEIRIFPKDYRNQFQFRVFLESTREVIYKSPFFYSEQECEWDIEDFLEEYDCANRTTVVPGVVGDWNYEKT